MKKSKNRNIVKKIINEEINNMASMERWRRVMNGKAFGKFIFYLEDPFGNKKRYIVLVKYKETLEGDTIYFTDLLLGSGTGVPFAVSNMQNKPSVMFGRNGQMIDFSDEETFIQEIYSNLGNSFQLRRAINQVYKKHYGSTLESEVRNWLGTGVMHFSNSDFTSLTPNTNIIGLRENKEVSIGNTVTIPSNLTTDPLNKQGESGKIVYINKKLNTVVIEFSDDLGLYSLDVFTNVSESTSEDKAAFQAKKVAIDKQIQALQKRKTELNKPGGGTTLMEKEDEDDWYKSEDDDSDLEKEPKVSDIKKGDPISKLAQKMAETQKEMKAIVSLWKKSEGEEKDKHLNRLKELTKVKKELEKMI